jgi:hypothetical protein
MSGLHLEIQNVGGNNASWSVTNVGLKAREDPTSGETYLYALCLIRKA